MNATYDPAAKTKWARSHRREGKCFLDVIAVIDLDEKPMSHGQQHAPVELRLYGTGNRNYACLWINCAPIHTQGSGWAGGYGYHRPSAAASEAIRNAGIALSEPIDGRGDDAMREACLAIARAVGVKRPAYVLAHA